MIRNAKVLGLALVAMLAMSAVVASAASATSFEAPGGETRVTASQVNKFEHTFTVTGGAVTCETASFSGVVPKGANASITVVPTYSDPGCLFAGVSATIDMNGCTYKLFATGSADIVCPESKEITVTVPPAPATTKCTIHVPAQTGLKTITYKNVGGASPTQEVEIAVNLAGIKYSETKGSGLGACANSEPVTQTNGTYTGKAVATGETTTGTPPTHTSIIWVA